MTSLLHVKAWRACACFSAIVLAGSLAASGDQDMVAAESAKTKAAILPITGQITDVTVESLERRIEEARSKGVEIIIFDMDTPGGLVTSSIAISDLIKNLTDIKTVTWVNPDAYSGGTIVAVACDEIVMARSSRMGDSQVIMGGPGGATAVPEDLRPKAYTPVLAEFRASCRLNGYDQVLCEAFVLPDREVWWLENAETGERRFVLKDEKMELLGEQDEKDATGDKDKDDDTEADTGDESTDADGAETEKVSAWRLVETYYDPLLEMEDDVIQPIVRDDQLLQMSAGEAEAYGFSRGVVANEQELRERYGIGSMVRIEPTWSEDLAFWMTSIYVRGFLMIIIMLGAYVEFHTPGVGVPGLVALICLGIFVGAPYLTGLANVWELIVLVVGVILLMLELFVIPGFGIPGIAGLILVFVAILATFVPDEPGRSFPLYLPSLGSTYEFLKDGLVVLVGSMVTSLAGMFLLSR
ncbi:MAG: hypothetical protein IH989_06685, partial [Planctomycetes bacterium]|nr:hypothetical protein [Planctomycetota bacterium]